LIESADLSLVRVVERYVILREPAWRSYAWDGSRATPKTRRHFDRSQSPALLELATRSRRWLANSVSKIAPAD
jgi:hypothetical protein